MSFWPPASLQSFDSGTEQHQDEFLPDQFLWNDAFPTTGFVGELTPPNTEPGMVRMRLLPDGRLAFLEAVAKENAGESTTGGADPARLFTAAGLDFLALHALGARTHSSGTL